MSKRRRVLDRESVEQDDVNIDTVKMSNRDTSNTGITKSTEVETVDRKFLIDDKLSQEEKLNYIWNGFYTGHICFNGDSILYGPNELWFFRFTEDGIEVCAKTTAKDEFDYWVYPNICVTVRKKNKVDEYAPLVATIGETQAIPHHDYNAETILDEKGWYVSLYNTEKEENVWTVHFATEEGLIDVGFGYSLLGGTLSVTAKSKSGIVYTIPVANPAGMLVARLEDDGSIPLV